jgi:hypothetical protein
MLRVFGPGELHFYVHFLIQDFVVILSLKYIVYQELCLGR